MKVVGIEAVAGTGKTVFAKHLLERSGGGRYVRASDVSPALVAVAGPLCIDDVSLAGAAQRDVATLVHERYKRRALTIIAGRSGVERSCADLLPHDVQLVGERDLRLPDDDVRTRLMASNASADVVDALVQRCNGWAAAVAFVEGRLRAGVPAAALARDDATLVDVLGVRRRERPRVAR